MQGESAMTPVAEDDPLMIAWRAYTATEQYANNLKWATNPIVPAHVEGALWGAFEAGFRATQGRSE